MRQQRCPLPITFFVLGAMLLQPRALLALSCQLPAVPTALDAVSPIQNDLYSYYMELVADGTSCQEAASGIRTLSSTQYYPLNLAYLVAQPGHTLTGKERIWNVGPSEYTSFSVYVESGTSACCEKSAAFTALEPSEASSRITPSGLSSGYAYLTHRPLLGSAESVSLPYVRTITQSTLESEGAYRLELKAGTYLTTYAELTLYSWSIAQYPGVPSYQEEYFQLVQGVDANGLFTGEVPSSNRYDWDDELLTVGQLFRAPADGVYYLVPPMITDIQYEDEPTQPEEIVTYTIMEGTDSALVVLPGPVDFSGEYELEPDISYPVLSFGLSHLMGLWEIKPSQLTFTFEGYGDLSCLGTASLRYDLECSGIPTLFGTHYGTIDIENETLTFEDIDSLSPTETMCMVLEVGFKDPPCPCEVYVTSLRPENVLATVATGLPALVTGEGAMSLMQIKQYPKLEPVTPLEVTLAPGESTPLTIGLEMETPLCGEVQALFALAEVPDGSEDYMLSSPPQSTSSDLALVVPITGNQASVSLKVGTLPGVYSVLAWLTSDDSDLQNCIKTVTPVEFTVTVAGLEVTALYDGNPGEVIGTFIQDIPLSNVFTADLYLEPGDRTTVSRVGFDLDGELVTDATAPYQASFDMAEGGPASWLDVTAELSKGAPVVAGAPVYAIPYPGWATFVETQGATVEADFEAGDERYAFQVRQYPGDIRWSQPIPDAVPLLGGTSCSSQLSYNADAHFYLSTASDFWGEGEEVGSLGNLEYQGSGSLEVAFDPEFKPLPGAWAETQGQLEGAMARVFSQSEALELLDTEVEVIYAVGLEATLTSHGLASLDQRLGLESLSLTPRLEGKGFQSMTFELGPLELVSRALACAEVDARLLYDAETGVREDHFGGAVAIRLAIHGGLSGGQTQTELASTMLGPFPFGDGPLTDTGEVSALVSCADGAYTPCQKLVAPPSLGAGPEGHLGLVRVRNRAAPGEPVVPEVGFLLKDRNGWRPEVPITPGVHWETEPAFTFLAGDTALAVWTSNDAPDGLTDLNLSLSGQDIAGAYFDGTSWTLTSAVIDDDRLDARAVLAWDGVTKQAMAVWQHNERPDYTVGQTEGWSLRAARFDPASRTWSAPEVVPGSADGGLPLRPTLVSAPQGGFFLLWVRDEDGALYTPVATDQAGARLVPAGLDQAWILTHFQDNAWSTPLEVGERTTALRLFPRLAALADGELIVSWVERGDGHDRLLLSRLQAADGTLETPQVLDTVRGLLEHPSLVVDDALLATVVYRRNHDGLDELFQARSSLSPQSPGAGPVLERLTREEGAAWAPASILDSEGNLLVAWARSDCSEGARGALSTLVGGEVQLGEQRKVPRGKLLSVGELRTRTDMADRIEALELPLKVSVAEAGSFSLRGRLFDQDGAPLVDAATVATSLGSGTHELILSFDGKRIAHRGAAGPYRLGELTLVDHALSPMEIDRPAWEVKSPPLLASSFVPPPLSLDRDTVVGEAEPLIVTLYDPGAAGTSHLTILNPGSSDVQTLSLPEVEPGVFRGEIFFSDGVEDPAQPAARRSPDEQPEPGEGPVTLLVTPASLVTFSFTDSEGITWRKVLGWLPLKPEPRRLDVELEPRRSGHVTGEGIDCPQDCLEILLHGSRTLLKAEPEPGYTFAGWQGDVCTGEGDCVLLMTRDVSVRAVFIPDDGPEETPTPGGDDDTEEGDDDQTEGDDDQTQSGDDDTVGPTEPPPSEGCGSCIQQGSSPANGGTWLLAGLLLLIRLRRQRTA